MLCIAGKNNIAVDVAKHILDFYPNVNLVGITVQNDDGIDKWQKSYKKFLRERDIPEVSLESIYDHEDLIFLSLEFDRIIVPKKYKSNRLFNIHFSLLPKYRGMYTSALPILNNEKETGVTLHYIDQGIDTGNIIDQIKFPIEFTDTAKDLYKKYISNGTKLIISWVPKLLDRFSFIEGVEQDYLQASYYGKKSIDYHNLKIDLNQCAVNIYNQIRAFHFREYQLPVVEGMKIFSCEITEKRSVHKPGTIIDRNDNSLEIATIDYNVFLHFDRFDE